jgi:hypothetical protein
MSTIAVRKAGFACIACDTLATIGALKQKSHYSAAPDKIFRFRDTYIGPVGYAVHNAVLQSYFSRYPDNVKLETPEEIFETWRVMHNPARGLSLNPRKETDDAYEDLAAFLAHSSRCVEAASHIKPSPLEAFPRFWAISSRELRFAVGARFTLFERGEDAGIARAG